MKKIIFSFIWTLLLLCSSQVFPQKSDSVAKPTWNHDIEGWFYFMQDDFIFSPIYGVDKGWLHLEARYNYEDENTFSAWFGYNFSGGNKFKYTITPMAGGLVGNIHGISPGLELDFDFFGFNFCSASEYVFDLQGKEKDFFYNWTDFTYTPVNWFWFGLSWQRTQLYQSDRELESGPMLGVGYKWFGLTGYAYSPFSDDPYFVLYLSITIP